MSIHFYYLFQEFHFININKNYLRHFQPIPAQISYNVPAVTDVFLRPKRKTRSVLRAQENVAEQNTTKGVSPTGVLCSPSRRKAAKQLQTC
jgi:hypothetical protein